MDVLSAESILKQNKKYFGISANKLMLFSKTSPLELFCSSSVSEVALNAVARSSCFNVRVIKKLNYVPVVEDGAKREGVVL